MVQPPLVFAVAGLLYDQLLNLPKALPAFQDAVRPFLPGYRQESLQKKHSLGAAQVVFEVERSAFFSEDGSEGVVIGDGGLLFMSTSYTTYAPFAGTLRKVLSALEHAVAGLSEGGKLNCTRVGLRYVDAFATGDDEEPEMYVSEGLRHRPPTARGHAEQGISICRFTMGSGTANVRFASGAGTPVVPPDLEPLPVGLRDEISQLAVAGRPISVLDTDRFCDVRMLLDVDKVIGVFDELHRDADQLFRTLITQHARKVWGDPTILGA
ncbi:TIGR04255 family protein [Tahibacter amnicola]|uniref:TIGR04255 family protein n=1 Tax=Tahibacter amnicola TaxID=2976241 RepID=A0ABY6BFY7_9GAMM|nr:TIGR04255 family protein [Tahibacter amnicola]UXI68943.1 TIGR04255 family protein [Tahibacter amnicola]